jgi:hypothetical protein
MKKFIAAIVLISATSALAAPPYCNPKAGAIYMRTADGVNMKSVSCYDLKKDYYMENTKEALQFRANQQFAHKMIAPLFGPGAPYVEEFFNYLGAVEDGSFSNASVENKLTQIQADLDFYLIDGELNEFEISLIDLGIEDINKEVNNYLANSNLNDEERERFIQLKDAIGNTKLAARMSEVNNNLTYKLLSQNEKLELITKNNKELKGHVERLRNNRKAISQRIDGLMQKQAQMYKSRGTTKKAERIRELKQFQAEIHDYKIFSQASLMALSMVNPELASDIGPVVNAAFTIIEASNKLNMISEGAAAGSALGPYGMMAMAAMSLMQSGKKNAQVEMYKAIMKALKKISQQIQDMHKDMMAGFDGIHNHLYEMEKRIMDKFQVVINQNNRLQKSLDELRLELNSLRNKLITDAIEDNYEIQINFSEQLKTISERCFNRLDREVKCFENYLGLLDNLRGSTNSTLTGIAVKDLVKERLEHHQMENNYGVFFNYLTYEKGISNLRIPLYRPLYSILLNDIMLYLGTRTKKQKKALRSNAYKKLEAEIDSVARSYEGIRDVLTLDFYKELREKYVEELKSRIAEINKRHEDYVKNFDKNSHGKEFLTEIASEMNEHSHKAKLENFFGLEITETGDVKYKNILLKKIEIDKWFDQLLTSKYAKERYKQESTTSIGFARVETGKMIPNPLRFENLVILQTMGRNYVAATTKQKPSLSLIDHSDFKNLAESEDEYYWVKGCGADTSPKFAIEKSRIKELLGEDVGPMIYASEQFIDICYRSKTKSESKLIDLRHYGPQKGMNKTNITLKHKTANWNALNWKIRGLRSVPGVKGIATKHKVLNHVYHIYNLKISAPRVEYVDFVVTLTTVNENGVSQRKSFSGLRKNYSANCFLQKGKPESIFDPFNINSFYSSDSECSAMESVFESNLRKLVKRDDFKKYVKKNKSNFKRTIEKSIKTIKNDMANYLGEMTPKNMSRLDELSFLLRGFGYFRHQPGIVDSWVQNSEVFPNEKELMDILSIQLKKEEFGKDSTMQRYKNVDTTAEFIEHLKKYMVDKSRYNFIDEELMEDDKDFYEAKVTQLPNETPVLITKEIVFDANGELKLGKCLLGDVNGKGKLAAGEKYLSDTPMVYIDKEGNEHAEVRMVSGDNAFILDCKGVKDELPTFKDMLESTRKYLAIEFI